MLYIQYTQWGYYSMAMDTYSVIFVDRYIVIGVSALNNRLIFQFIFLNVEIISDIFLLFS